MEFTLKDFEGVKEYNRNKNRRCFMCLEAYKKPFEKLTEGDKYHVMICNPKKPFEWNGQITVLNNNNR